MTNIADDLAAILQTIRRPGDFHTSGAFDLRPPEIEIEGFGVLALPVLPDQAQRLVAVAEHAPFGRGQATLVDPSVRRSWQISPERVRISGKSWNSALEEVLARAASGLGVSDAVEAQFYKLLVYETGGFFIDHRDTEKSPGMFATLTIALPSRSTGGELVVRHAWREARIDMVSDDPAEARFAAFYADCVHEVRPVGSGCRLTLVYNLIRKGAGKAPDPPRHEREEKKLTDLLGAWARDVADPEAHSPPKLVYPLSHAYTPAELAFASLKGADAAAAGVLARAAAQVCFDVHLALLTIERTTSAEYTGRGRSGWGRWSEPDDGDYEEGEVYEHSQTLSNWKRPDGAACDFGDMPVAEDEFSPADALEGMTPDEQHLHEATGNEGASLERTYRRAALVLWPTAAFLEMLASNGLSVSLPYLKNVVDRWRQGAPDAKVALAEEATALADAMIAQWPASIGYRRDDTTTSATPFLELLADIGAGAQIALFLRRRQAGEDRTKADNPSVIRALTPLVPSERVELIEHLIKDSGARFVGASADLLRRANRAWDDLAGRDLKAAADLLLVFVPSQLNRPFDPLASRLDDKFVFDLVSALDGVEPSLALRAVEAILSSPKTFGMDSCLVPALRALIQEPANANAPAVAKLRSACIEHLRARIAKPLAPPADFTRASSLTCSCSNCTELSKFLADPSIASWSLKAPQNLRSHVETTILNSHCDVDTTTERKGSPHRLVVKKNQASYKRLAEQRREDVENLTRIERVPR
jgi:predicted 2-oxoglutarate/Fe(II)-dependent dioxygenase YbiX